MVLPITAKVNSRNHLEIGGCDTVELASRFGTPLFVLDRATIVEQSRRYLEAFSDPELQVEIVYAGKAFLSIGFCQLIDSLGLSLDVASGGELFVAGAAGFPMDRVYLHGNNKSAEELKMALDFKVGRIVVDSFDELDLLERLAGEVGEAPSILLRITPGVRPETHEATQTGQTDSKFGFGISEGTAMRAVQRAVESEAVHFVGLHMHIGSQIHALNSFTQAIEMAMAFAEEVRQWTGVSMPELNLGGGLGIQYLAADQPSTIEEYAGTILEGMRRATKDLDFPLPKLMVEPGRSIVGNAGVTLYRIGTIKKIAGMRTYVSVDGGMSDNLRPMLYSAVYDGIVANKAGDDRVEEVTVAGKHCESGDILIQKVTLPKVEVGDILCTPATGAYGYVMANNYNMQPKPAVVMVADGNPHVLIAREKYEDLVRLHHPLS